MDVTNVVMSEHRVHRLQKQQRALLHKILPQQVSAWPWPFPPLSPPLLASQRALLHKILPQQVSAWPCPFPPLQSPPLLAAHAQIILPQQVRSGRDPD